ncbi:actin maturation protease [Onthophagus taurus]|uniref:actin maturation protease n=1 Tax=Onthophagus taurus TaxID=166361 RepID=UPI000C207F9B|nr:UPF0692 protein CG33108 [Onthophagus taurus]
MFLCESVSKYSLYYFYEMDFSWLEPYPDLQKQCKLFQMVELLHPKEFKYKPLGVLIQDGPQCGIVALALLTANPTKETVNLIYQEAVRRKFSINGEMFSCYNMCELANQFTTYRTQVFEGTLNSGYIKHFLFDGGCLLVPYDVDKNDEPCLNNGTKAHWAVISGIIETEDDCYVLAKQGKSKRIGIWKLKDLSDSNGQLNMFSPVRCNSDLAYILPDGGVKAGLCNKCVLLFQK